VGDLFGFKMVLILPIFLMLGILRCVLCKGSDGYRPEMFQGLVGDAIRASAGGGFCEVNCGLGHVGCDWRWGVGVWSLFALYSVECFVCGVEWNL